jgi:hypothetical protein
MPTGTNNQDIEANHFTPISSRQTNNLAPSARLAISRTTTRGSSRSRYHGGQDGYSVFTNDDEPDNVIDEPEVMASDNDFLVKWDGGDADPLNPRSEGKLRKWLIVLVISMSSLCV